MVSNLQFAAVATYLLWCLFASLTDMLGSEHDDARANFRETDKNATVGWREGAPWGRGGSKGAG
ncbi:hypothetical protein A5662_08330 [Mycobacteriaceae bacterium 1482268.1]|nr:hypothetical protein A5662_08330 [Mycobacteriaceae bacterium 1482268.1]